MSEVALSCAEVAQENRRLRIASSSLRDGKEQNEKHVNDSFEFFFRLLQSHRMPPSIFHTISPKDIWLGDHVYVWKLGIVYQHHGIVLFVDKHDHDQSEVLEFNTDDGSLKPWRARIQIVTLKQFRGSNTLKRVVYGSRYALFKRAGTAHRFQSLPPEVVVDNARRLLKQIDEGDLATPNDPTCTPITYDIILRNCECLALWCKTGQWCSDQVGKMINSIGDGLIGLLKVIAFNCIPKDIVTSIGQESLSEAIELALPSITEQFCHRLAREAIGNVIAFVILELVKVVLYCYQYKHGQMNTEELRIRILQSIVIGLTNCVCATAIQAFLLFISSGAGAPICSVVGGSIAAILGPIIGNIINRYLFDKPMTSHDAQESEG